MNDEIRMETFTIYIKTDGFEEIGLGHLMRCLTIGDCMDECSDMDVRYIINEKSIDFFSKYSNKRPYILSNTDADNGEAMEICALLQKKHAHLLITDTYLASKDFYSLLRKKIPSVPVLVIDDAGEKADFPVSGFINFNVSANKDVYPATLSKYSAIGSKYYPLRKEFCNERNNYSIKDNKSLQRVLVAMGGSDPEGQTVRIVSLLKSIKTVKNVDVLAGPACDALEDIEQCIADDNRFSLFHNPSDVASLITRADLAITGGGATCIECISLKVPVALIILAANQQPLKNFIEKKGCGMVLGNFDDISDDDLVTKIRHTINHPSQLSEMTKACHHVIDGKGGTRLSEWIQTYLRNYHKDKYLPAMVKAEYEKAAENTEEYAKLLWGSPEGMTNRHLLAFKSIRWETVHSWLDIGCGTGALLREVEKRIFVNSYLGIDISPSQINYAKSNTYNTGDVSFKCNDFITDIEGVTFDLVTAIGILHKCGASLQKSVARIAELVSPGGQIFLTTKNLDWYKFKDPEYTPHPGHHWFHLSDIRETFLLAGLEITSLKGFEPRVEGKITAPEDSHSVFILARKGVEK